MADAWAMTYDNLVSTTLLYVERTDTAAINQVPVAIALTEYDIATKLKILGQIEIASFAFNANDNALQKPARWRKTTSMSVVVDGVRQPVYDRKLEYVQNYIASGAPAGAPEFYSDADYDHWVFAPIPDKGYTAEVVFYARLAPLSSINQTNFLTTTAPQALLYGTLLQMTPFLKADARIATFKGLYDEALAALKGEDITRTGDRQAIAVDS